MTQEKLICEVRADLENTNPRTEIKKYGLVLLKNHHQQIEKEHYLKYRNMIAKLSWKCSTYYSIPFDEVMSEGNLVYCTYLQKYAQNRYSCSFSTFLYRNLANKLKWYCRRQLKRRHINEDIEKLSLAEVKQENSYESLCVFKSSLKKQSQEIIDMIQDQDSLFEFYRTQDKLTMQSITKYLTQQGWKKSEIQNSFAEIRRELKTIC